MRRANDMGWLISILAGYLPSGIAYGAIATAVNIPWFYTLALSFVVYSGAVQSAFVGLWSFGLEPFSMILTAFLLNMRHTFYGPHLEEHFGEVRRADVLTIGPLLTDEIYAVGVGSHDLTPGKLRKISFFAYACWIIGTAVGVASTGGMPGFLLPILYLALPSLFLGLMMPKIKGNSTAAAATFSVVISVVFRLYGFPSYFLLLSIAGGVVAGITFTRLRRGSPE